ncbi:polysaccharide biosynthesis/export family protein [Thiolinea disciformis]|uniref:polysaccharide biosynthesis/export family protein n=1 Tax=Thiolinea disciformis TaxID=125614 RepID=UPI0003709232|nr:SLBB domain-containing protein [Thiolinea disciformis]
MKMKKVLQYLSIALLISVLSTYSYAEGELADKTANDISVRAPNVVQAFDDVLPAKSQNGAGVPPFAANLFAGNYVSRRADALDPDYKIVTGDRIALRMWGEVTANETLTVDANGNIFIPDAGELNVVGTTAANLSAKVKSAISKVYKDGVDVYANLLSATPKQVLVFVTGQVNRPGQYTGLPDDSVVAFLQQAGGVDPQRGSYRQVLVTRRGGQRVASIDLYDFVNNGRLPRLLFQDGDTIVVRPQGNMVTVQGDTRNSYRFEFLNNALTGEQLVRYARPNSSVTHVAVAGTREGLPSASYITYSQFLGSRLYDGDSVRFVTDAPSDVMDIALEGSFLGTSYFTVQKSSRLQEVLDYVAVDPNEADIGNIYIKRKSVALAQKKNLEESLQRLERSVLTAPASSDGEASIRAQEANLILKFVERASKVQPEGRVVVSDRGKVANIRLEDGDIIVIPNKSDVVSISGEVQMPHSVVYASNATVLDYIAQAGGFSDRANRKDFIIVRPNGKVEMGSQLRVQPGDQIMVSPQLDSKDMQFTKDIVQIVYQIAVAAKAVGL